MIRDWSNFIAGRTALVTGAGGGVGRAIAIQMARAGAELWINDIHLDRAEKVCREIEEERGVATPVVADVCERDQVDADDRGDRSGRHPREQRGHPGRGLRGQVVRRHRPGGMGPAHPAQPRRGARRHPRLPPAHARAAVGPHPHDRLGRRPQGRAQAGGLRRGEGRGDGLLARARGRGRARRRDRQLHRARHDAPRPARRGDRRATPSSSTGSPRRTRRAGSARSTTPRRSRCCCAATRRPGSPGRCIRWTAAMPPHSESAEHSVELPTGYVVRHPADAGLAARSPRSSSPATSPTSASPTSPRTTSSTTGAGPASTLDHDAWVLSGPTGRIVGYAFVWEAQPGTEIEGDAFVLPEYSGRGLGTLLLELMESRARRARGRARP